eukprot:TRINITY_DN14673_c0_g1_i4.p1 TRINITY_DN14673_c0_g1~~TRINITY_DN14673_c0_g1_i4.p1  ORF type:complete len:111 (+),score=8.44 TRINITY_DN14673_c0_g1_i4:141-473(+)
MRSRMSAGIQIEPTPTQGSPPLPSSDVSNLHRLSGCPRHRSPVLPTHQLIIIHGNGNNWWRLCTSLSDVTPAEQSAQSRPCLLYTSDAADEEDSVDLGGRRIIKKKKKEK